MASSPVHCAAIQKQDAPVVVAGTLAPRATTTSPTETIQQVSSTSPGEASKSANASEPPTSFDLLSPAYLAVFPIFVVILFVIAWLLMVPNVRRPWSCRSHRRSIPVQLRERGPGDAYEIAPEMWRGGGRFVGESTRTRYNTGEGDRFCANRSYVEPRGPDSMNIARGTERTNAMPTMPGQARPGQHFGSGTTDHIPYELYVNTPLVPMVPTTSAS